VPYEYVGPPLTRSSAAELLDARGINPIWYSLTGAQVYDGFVMRQTPEGWAVFYTERGDDRMHTVHTTEAEACRDLVERILNDRGLYPPKVQ
jgi:hypothetical protein